MTTKAQTKSEGREPAEDVRVHIKLMSSEKTISINIEDLDGCIKAKGLKKERSALLKGFSELLQDVHSSNEDATTITLTPKNVEKVLGAEPLEREDEPPNEDAAD
jgi:endonuclease III